MIREVLAVFVIVVSSRLGLPGFGPAGDLLFGFAMVIAAAAFYGVLGAVAGKDLVLRPYEFHLGAYMPLSHCR